MLELLSGLQMLLVLNLLQDTNGLLVQVTMVEMMLLVFQMLLLISNILLVLYSNLEVKILMEMEFMIKMMHVRMLLV